MDNQPTAGVCAQLFYAPFLYFVVFYVGPKRTLVYTRVCARVCAQGKTSTLAKFIAALAVYSETGGLLATIYSTGLDRAVELVKAAKQYLSWMQKPAGQLAGYEKIQYRRDNERSFVLLTPSGVLNEISARPRNVESCRGDAPHAAFFDEAAFMSSSFWWNFAYPLLQVKGRVFTCTTTPPPADNYFADFALRVKEQNLKGDTFFYLVNHALACAARRQCCLQLLTSARLLLRWRVLQ